MIETLSAAIRFATELMGSAFASEYVKEVYGAKFTKAQVVVSARTIVESGVYYPGDVVEENDWDVDPTMAFHRIFAEKITNVSAEFEQSIADNGIQYPITLCDIKPEHVTMGIVPRWMRPGIRVCDGHHRLYVAYEHDLNVPVVFVNPHNLRADYHNSPDPIYTSLPKANR